MSSSYSRAAPAAPPAPPPHGTLWTCCLGIPHTSRNSAVSWHLYAVSPDTRSLPKKTCTLLKSMSVPLSPIRGFTVVPACVGVCLLVRAPFLAQAFCRERAARSAKKAFACERVQVENRCQWTWKSRRFR